MTIAASCDATAAAEMKAQQYRKYLAAAGTVRVPGPEVLAQVALTQLLLKQLDKAVRHHQLCHCVYARTANMLQQTTLLAYSL